MGEKRDEEKAAVHTNEVATRGEGGGVEKELKQEKIEKRGKKIEQALCRKGATSSTGCASHSIINFVELLYRM